MTQFLVTGGGGFIGKELCAELCRRGYRVTAAIRAPHTTQGGAIVAVGAVDGDTDWTAALEGVDAVIHLAARVHVTKELATDPLSEFLRTNLQGTENLARQAASAKVKRCVFVSSIKVNGESTYAQDAFSEASTPDPKDAYAISKWHAEQALRRIATETGIEVVIVRPPLVYGPSVKGNFLSLLQAIHKGIPLPLAGAQNKRSLLYVGNLVDALILCATHPAAAGKTYLLSDGEAISTAMLTKRIAQSLGRPDRAFYLPPGFLRAVARLLGRAEQVDRLFGSLVVSDAKIRRELGWQPPYTFEDGLRATAEWFVAQRTGVGYNRRSL